MATMIHSANIRRRPTIAFFLLLPLFISCQPGSRAKKQPRWRSSVRADLASGGANALGPSLTPGLRAAMQAGFIPDFAKVVNKRVASGAGKSAPFGRVEPGEDDGHGRIQDALVYPTCYNITHVFPLTITNANALKVPWEGWGTTLSFIGRYIGGLSNPDDRKSLLSLLFDPTVGLGLTRARYMIPPSLNWKYSKPIVWWGDHDYYPYNLNPGVYNWSADYKQVLAVQEAIQIAAAANNTLHVDGISLSPPWYMSVSRDVAGGVNGTQNIEQGNMTSYADFLLLLSQHLASDYGVKFETLCAMNEPLEMWWKAGSSKIGCSFTPEGARQMFDALQQQKQAAGMDWLTLVGVDSWANKTTSLLADTYSGTKPPFSYATVHGYLDDLGMTMLELEKQQSAMRQAASKAGLKLWQTEWGPFWVYGTDLETALFLGRSIAEHINIMGVSAWFHFLAIHRMNSVRWGTVMVNVTAGAPVEPVIVKQFYATLHYSRLIPEGSIILKVPRRCYHGVVAAYNEARNQLIVSAANQQNATFHIRLWFQGFKRKDIFKPFVISSYLTNDTSNFKSLRKHKKRTLLLPIDFWVRKQSISSLVISNVVKVVKKKW